MRAAEYGVVGDDRAELSVFYFGPDQGGAVEPNIQRWLGQFSQPDGSDTAQKAKRSEAKLGGMNVATIEVSGTYSASMGMPGAAPAAPQPNALLLGAIVSGPKGPVFFKLTGPRESVERARPGFDALLRSLRPE